MDAQREETAPDEDEEEDEDEVELLLLDPGTSCVARPQLFDSCVMSVEA